MADAPFVQNIINIGGGGAGGGAGTGRGRGAAPPTGEGGLFELRGEGGQKRSAEYDAMAQAWGRLNRKMVEWDALAKQTIKDEKALTKAQGEAMRALDAYQASNDNYVNKEAQVATALKRTTKALKDKAAAELKAKVAPLAKTVGPLERAAEAYRIKGVHDPQLYRQLEGAIKKTTDAREKLIGTGVKHTATEKQAAAAVMRGTKALGQYKVEASEAGSALGGLAKRMQRIALWAIGWNLMYSAINKVREALWATAQRAMDMENVIARVGMVIKVSNEAIREQVDLLSKRYGRSVTEVGQAMEAFARQGIGFANAVEMSNLALQGSLALGDPVSQMVNRLTGLYHGWKLSVSETRLAMDDIIATSKRAAITAGDLADAHIRIAATARDIGIEFGDVNRLIIAFAESMRLTGREASTTLNTLLQRLQRPRTVAVLRQAGIEAERGGGELRPPMEILSEMAEKWGDIAKWLKRDILEAAAGLRRGRQMRAMMANLPDIINRIDDSIDSAGETAKDATRAMATFTEQMKRVGEGAAGFWEEQWAKIKLTYGLLAGGKPGAAPAPVGAKYGLPPGLEAARAAGTFPGGAVGERGLQIGMAETRGVIHQVREGTELTYLQASQQWMDMLVTHLEAVEPDKAKVEKMIEDAQTMIDEEVLPPLLARAARAAAKEAEEAERPQRVSFGPQLPGYERFMARQRVAAMAVAGRGSADMLIAADIQDLMKQARGRAERPGAYEAGVARTPEQRSQERVETLKRELGYLEHMAGNLNAIVENEKDLTGRMLTETEIREKQAAQMKVGAEIQRVKIALQQESLRLIREEIAERVRLTEAMRSAVSQGFRGILVEGQRTGAEFGKTIGNAIADQAMKAMMESDAWNSILEGLTGQAGGWGGKGITEGMSGWQAALGYAGAGLMGYQQTQAAGKEGYGGAIGAVGGYAVGGPVGGMLGGYLGSLFDKDADIQEEQLEVAIAYYDASLQELKLSNRHLATMAAAEEYGLPGSYYYRQRAGTGVQVQNLLFTARDGITQVMYADLTHTARGAMVI